MVFCQGKGVREKEGVRQKEGVTATSTLITLAVEISLLGKSPVNSHTSLMRSDHFDNGEGLVRLEERCLPPSPVP